MHSTPLCRCRLVFRWQTVGIDNARNAALLAVQIMAIADEKLMDALIAFRRKLADASRQKTAKIRQRLHADS